LSSTGEEDLSANAIVYVKCSSDIGHFNLQYLSTASAPNEISNNQLSLDSGTCSYSRSIELSGLIPNECYSVLLKYNDFGTLKVIGPQQFTTLTPSPPSGFQVSIVGADYWGILPEENTCKNTVWGNGPQQYLTALTIARQEQNMPVTRADSKGYIGPNPALKIVNIPSATKDMLIVVQTNIGGTLGYDWVLYDLHPSETTFTLEQSTTLGTNGPTRDGVYIYWPPCSSGPGFKVYNLTVFALTSPVMEASFYYDSITGQNLVSYLSTSTIVIKTATTWYSSCHTDCDTYCSLSSIELVE